MPLSRLRARNLCSGICCLQVFVVFWFLQACYFVSYGLFFSDFLPPINAPHHWRDLTNTQQSAHLDQNIPSKPLSTSGRSSRSLPRDSPKTQPGSDLKQSISIISSLISKFTPPSVAQPTTPPSSSSASLSSSTEPSDSLSTDFEEASSPSSVSECELIPWLVPSLLPSPPPQNQTLSNAGTRSHSSAELETTATPSSAEPICDWVVSDFPMFPRTPTTPPPPPPTTTPATIVVSTLDPASSNSTLTPNPTVIFDTTLHRDLSDQIVIRIGAAVSAETYRPCAVTCIYQQDLANTSLNWGRDVVHSMESQTNYPHIAVETAHRNNIRYVMTTRLDSDVPMPYFSWVEYNLMDPAGARANKTDEYDAVVVMSNCQATNFRMAAVDKLHALGVKIDKYGTCYGRRFPGSKTDLLQRYRFYLAFENSVEDDYVTEKFWHGMVAGSVPIVIGAPNIRQFAPSERTLLHIGALEDCEAVAKQVNALRKNPTQYRAMLEWKFKGPNADFLALADLGVVHSSCRLCIKVATDAHVRTRTATAAAAAAAGAEGISPTTSCKCAALPPDQLQVHVRVRERGQYHFDDVIITLPCNATQLRHAFTRQIVLYYRSIGFQPIWREQRKDFLHSKKHLHLHRVYSVTENTVKSALFGANALATPAKFLAFFAHKWCHPLELIFV